MFSRTLFSPWGPDADFLSKLLSRRARRRSHGNSFPQLRPLAPLFSNRRNLQLNLLP